MSAPARTLLLALVLAGAGGCGYSFGTGLHEKGIRTVAFQVVGNETYRQRLEVDLSRYLARELPVTTDLQLASRGDADATLQVVLTDARERTLVPGVPDPRNPGDRQFPRVREGAFEASISVRLIGRDGTIVLERRILDRTEFRSPLGENLTTARGELAEDLARKIALALEDDF